MPTDDVRTDAIDLLTSLKHHPGCPLTDGRLPPPDMLGHLADLQIHRSHLVDLERHIREDWPGVVGIDCGLRQHRHVYVAIRIDPYSDETARKHWKLADWIQEKYPGFKDSFFYFLPPHQHGRPTPSTVIFPVSTRHQP